MVSPAQYAAIEALAEKGPSRELDFYIWLVAKPHPTNPPFECSATWDGSEFKIEGGGFIGGHMVPAYSSSLDAALTLVEDKWDIEIKRARHRAGWMARIWPYQQDVARWADATKPAIALALAALKAMVEEAAKETEDD